MEARNGLLEWQQVEISYGSQIAVLDFNLKIQQGEIIGIVGESGSGKSSVIRGAMGLLGKDGIVTKGNIYYKGNDLNVLPPKEFRKIRGSKIGMIFQNTGASLCPIRKIEDQLYETVLAHEKRSRDEIKKHALEILDRMNLKNGEEILKSYPFQLSGGMNQRIGIMFAMILKPTLLLADEPTSALDVTVQKQVIDEMRLLREHYGTAIVIVTHNIGVVEYMADKVAVMHQGRLVECGDTKRVIRAPEQAYTKQLLQSVLHVQRDDKE